MRYSWSSCLSLVILILIITSEVTDSARKSSGRRRGKQRKKHNSARLFGLSSRFKGYYESEDGAEIIKSSHFDYEFDLGHKIVFICVAKGNPIPSITWFKDTVELFSHPYLQISEWRLNETHVKSKLEIDPARQMDAGTYECEANNKYSVDRRNFKADF